MRTSLIAPVLAAALLVTAGQTQTGPGISVQGIPAWIIYTAFNVVPGTDIRNVKHVKLSNNPDGVWTTALNVGGLAASSGGVAGVGVLMGIFDPYNGTFIANNEAANLNSVENDNYVSLSPDGLWALLERPSGLYLASRAAVGMQFGTPVSVSGLSAGLIALEPSLGPVGGQMKVFYSDASNILMQDIDLPSATVSGNAVIVSNPVQLGAVPTAPSVVLGADGDVEALWASEWLLPRQGPNTGDSDPVWISDLDPSTPAVVHIQRNDWQCCGSVAGGFIYYTHDIPPAWHTMHSEGAWLVGDTEPLLGTVDITTGAPNYSAPNPIVSYLMISGGEGPRVPLSIIKGFFALDAGTLAGLAIPFQTTSKDGIASLSFTMNNDPALMGQSFAIQALIADFTRLTYAFTNTSWLHIL